MRLTDKVSLITGAGSGIGAATAKTFAREGVAVVVVDLNDEGGSSVVADINRVRAQRHPLQCRMPRPDRDAAATRRREGASADRRAYPRGDSDGASRRAAGDR